MSRGVVRIQIDKVEEKGGLMYVSGRGLAGERLVDVLYMQPHGGAFHPPIGSYAVAVDLSGRREQMVVLGGESPDLRPTGAGLGEGNAVLYNAHGQAVSILNNEIRIVGGDKVTIVGAEIVLEAGAIKLGSAGAARELALRDTVDSAGQTLVANLATKVFAE